MRSFETAASALRALLWCALITETPTFAQSVSGTISGSVVDASGNAAAGALTSESTGTTRTTITRRKKA